MGILRIYLAISVLAAHSGVNVLPWPMHSSVEAVQIFFLISGFYMALISNKYRSAVEFYASRFLRIFIPYYTILAIVLATSVATGLAFGQWLDLGPLIQFSTQTNGLAGFVFAVISNFILFFQDWVMFLEHDAGRALSFTTDFQNSGYPLYHYLLIQQAWTIGTELTFYLLVPWLSKLRSAHLILIAAASLALRIYTYQVLQLTNDPFTYRFFPFELMLFVVGMLAYRAYAASLAGRAGFKISNLFQYAIYVAVIVLFLHLAQQVPLTLHRSLFHRSVAREYSFLVTYAGWAAVIPVLYHLTRNMRVDRFIGELSYPVYLLHVVVIQIVDLVLVQLSLTSRLLGVISAVLTVSLAALLYVRIFRPFEVKRPQFAKELAQRWSARWKKIETRPEHSLGANPRE